MRAVSVHPDAIVVTSLFWQTNAIALRAGGEAILRDTTTGDLVDPRPPGRTARARCG